MSDEWTLFDSHTKAPDPFGANWPAPPAISPAKLVGAPLLPTPEATAPATSASVPSFWDEHDGPSEEDLAFAASAFSDEVPAIAPIEDVAVSNGLVIHAACDGSAKPNPGPSGWCWYASETSWRAGGCGQGTNNIGELRAVIEILKDVPAAYTLHLRLDSQYVLNSATKWRHGWKKKGWKNSKGQPVENLALQQEMDRLLMGRTVTFTWVKAHQTGGDPLNAKADYWAQQASEAVARGADSEFGPGFTPEA